LLLKLPNSLDILLFLKAVSFRIHSEKQREKQSHKISIPERDFDDASGNGLFGGKAGYQAWKKHVIFENQRAYEGSEMACV